MAWSRLDPGCPAFLFATRTVTLFQEGDTKLVELGGVAIPRGGDLAYEDQSIHLEVPPAGDRIRVTAQRCIATGELKAEPLGAQEAERFVARRSQLRSAGEHLGEMTKAVDSRDLQGALRHVRLACDLRRSVLGDDHPLVATCEIQQARRENATQSFDEGLRLARSAATSLARLPGGRDSLEYLSALQVQSQSLYLLSRPAENLEVASQALAGRTRILGAGHIDTLGSQGMVAIALFGLGRLDEAASTQEQLVRLHTAREGAAGPETIRAKLNLSATLQRQGDYERVVALQREIVEARRSVLGVSDPATLASTHDLGVALADAGQLDEALAVVSGALPLFLERFGPDNLQTFRAKQLLGTIYDRLGRVEEAAALYADVYAGRRRLLGDGHGITASSAYSLASALLRLDRPAEALELAQGALLSLSESSRRSSPSGQGLLLVQADALLRLGDARRALDTLEGSLGARALTQEEARVAPVRRLEIAYQWSQATFAVGRVDDAVRSIDDLYHGCAQRFGPAHPMTLEAMGAVARMLAAAGSTDAAMRLLAEYVDVQERQMRDGFSMNSANRGRLAEGVRDRPYSAGYRTYVRLLATRDPVRALEIAELTKARSLSETLSRPRADPPAVIAARIRLARADERIAENDVGTPLYLKAVSDRARAEEDLRRSAGPLSRTTPVQDLQATLKRSLSSGTVFVEFIVSGDNVVAMVGSASGKVVARDLGSIAGLADLVEAFRRVTTSQDPRTERLWQLADGRVLWSLSQPAGGATRLLDPDAIVKRLSSRLLDPIASEITGARSWIISPDGPLAFLPFELLRLGRQQVVETKNVTYVPSLSSLAIMPAQVTTGPRWDFLGVGISRFDAGQQEWRALPYAEREVSEIASMFPVSRTLSGSEATEPRMRSLDTAGELRRYRFVHFATHAFLSDRGTSLSGVVLSGAPGSDGVITAAEWPTYRLGSELVVLSACDTGLGALVAGEGVVGLPSAFLSAGTRAVILTLWSVADESAADFMPRFYRRLKAGKSPAEALRETKLEFARSKGPWSSPRHWAPYVLYGAS